MYKLSSPTFLLSFNPSYEGWIDNDSGPEGRWREKEDRFKGDAETLADCCTLINYVTELSILPTHWSHPLIYLNMCAHNCKSHFLFVASFPLKKTVVSKALGQPRIYKLKRIY